MKVIKIKHKILCDNLGCGEMSQIGITAKNGESIQNLCGECARKLLGCLNQSLRGSKDAKKI